MDSTLNSISKEIEDRDEKRKLQQKKNKEIHQLKQIDLSNSNNISKCINEINKLEKEIENELKQIENESQIKDSINLDSLKKQFEDIEHKIASMRLLLAESNHFLPLFEIKNLNSIKSNVQKNTNLIKDKVIPKQKFSFKRTPRSTPIPSPSQTTLKNTTTTPISTTTTTKTIEQNELFDNSNIKGFNGKELVYPPTTTETTTTTTEAINDLFISNLVDCKVILKMKVLTALKIDNLKNCTIISHSPIDGSIFIDNCNDTTFTLSSRQIRIHYSNRCRFNIFVKSNPIIEGCKGIKFSYYPHKQLELTDQDYQRFNTYNFDLININADTEKWKEVNDFDWLQSKPSPNWELVKEE